MKNTATSSAECLTKNKEFIIQTWSKRSRAEIKHAENLREPILRDSLPVFLDELIESLRHSPGESSTSKEARTGLEHGYQRGILTDYSLEEVIEEYRILREVIFAKLEDNNALSSTSRDIILNILNLGVAKAATAHANIQRRQVDQERKLLVAVIDQLPSAVWIAEAPSGRALYENSISRSLMPKLSEHLGYHPDGRRLRDDEWPMIRALLRGDKVDNEDIEIERFDGTKVLARFSATPIHDDQGQIVAGAVVASDMTAEIIAKRRLEQSQERLSLALSAAHMGTFEWDVKTNRHLWSKETEALFGFDPGEFNGTYEQLRDRIHPEDLPQARINLEAAIQHKTDYSTQYRILLPDGGIRWIATRGRPHFDGDGELSYILGVSSDNTNISQAQELSNKSKERLQLITDMQPMLISYLDTSYRYQFANKAYNEWFHRGDKPIAGENLVDIIGAEASRAVEPYIKRAFNGERVTFEKYISYQRSTIRFVHATYMPDFDANGRVIGIFISVFDMTTQKKVEEALQASEERYRKLTELAPQIIWTADAEGITDYQSPAFERFTGAKNGDAIGNEWLKWIHPDDLNLVTEKWGKSVKEKTTSTIEFRLRRRDDEYIWFTSRGTPLKNEKDDVVQWIGVATDISQIKDAESKVRQSLTKLEELQEIRERFVAALTHDLRTPLAALKMGAQLISRQQTKPEIVASLSGRILGTIERMEKMIQDLLDATRLRAGQKVQINLEKTDLAALAQSTIEDLTLVHGDRFRLTMQENLEARCDPSGIRRVIENLANNAIKYGYLHAPIQIRIERETRWIKISVQNEGEALTEADRKSLFSHLRRTQSAEKSGKQGWGIGLTLVKGIAEAHGGYVEVNSDVTGNTFVVCIPEVLTEQDTLSSHPTLQ
jgi:PAS domain S-box-containing protein